jgi:hypothetical protein
MKTFKEIYQQIVRQQPNKDDDNLSIVKRRQQQKDKIRDDEKTIEYEENGTIENKEKYVALGRNYKAPNSFDNVELHNKQIQLYKDLEQYRIQYLKRLKLQKELKDKSKNIVKKLANQHLKKKDSNIERLKKLSGVS